MAQAHPEESQALRNSIMAAIADLFREMQLAFHAALSSPAASSVIPFKGERITDPSSDYSQAVDNIVSDVAERQKKRSSVFGNPEAKVSALARSVTATQQQLVTLLASVTSGQSAIPSGASRLPLQAPVPPLDSYDQPAIRPGWLGFQPHSSIWGNLLGPLECFPRQVSLSPCACCRVFLVCTPLVACA